MRSILLFTLLLFLNTSCQSGQKEKTNTSISTTVYYFIRHAEKDRSNVNNSDPELTEIGIQRAKNWAKYFEKIELDEIYSTNYKRTQQTVQFTAAQKNIEIQSYDPRDLYNEEFKKNTRYKTVLIVGHSNTTPTFVNTVLGKQEYSQIDDTNNGNLYIVTIENGEVTSVLKHFN